MVAAPQSLQALCQQFKRLCGQEEGVKLLKLLEPDQVLWSCCRAGESPQIKEMALAHGGEQYGEVLALYIQGLRAGAEAEQVRQLELVCTCLKTWAQRYIEADGSGLWMTPLLMHLSAMARRVAVLLDKEKRSDAQSDTYLKKLVEIHRELFQKLNKERMKRAGHVWVCCELLRAYFQLGQISQCAFLLTAMSQSLNKDGFNPTDLPKSIAISFFYYWGKHCVFNHDLQQANEKLSWAFANCPAKCKNNRRQILLYLVPCKLRLGVLPTQQLLQTHDLVMFIDIVRAIREGNVKLFTERMQEYSADFIKNGTYLLMMKLKFMVLRNLTKGVHGEIRRRLGESATTKLDLAPFEHIFAWQDDCDVDETACVLSNLIYQGAVKGYMSHEHRKLVFAKEQPFPAPSKWRV